MVYGTFLRRWRSVLLALVLLLGVVSIALWVDPWLTEYFDESAMQYVWRGEPVTISAELKRLHQLRPRLQLPTEGQVQYWILNGFGPNPDAASNRTGLIPAGSCLRTDGKTLYYTHREYGPGGGYEETGSSSSLDNIRATREGRP
jgi:hypothetical protein